MIQNFSWGIPFMRQRNDWKIGTFGHKKFFSKNSQKSPSTYFFSHIISSRLRPNDPKFLLGYPIHQKKKWLKDWNIWSQKKISKNIARNHHPSIFFGSCYLIEIKTKWSKISPGVSHSSDKEMIERLEHLNF